MEELNQSQQQLFSVQNSQKEVESWIDQMEFHVHRLLEDAIESTHIRGHGGSHNKNYGTHKVSTHVRVQHLRFCATELEGTQATLLREC